MSDESDVSDDELAFLDAEDAKMQTCPAWPDGRERARPRHANSRIEGHALRRCLISHGPCDRLAVCGVDGPCGRAPIAVATVRQQLEAGARWQSGGAGECVVCFERGPTHFKLGLCRPCFRAWRFGSQREYEVKA